MPQQKHKGHFKAIFGRGLAILLPSIVTLWLLWQASIFVFNNVAEPINAGIRAAMLRVVPLMYADADTAAPDWYLITDADRADAAERLPRNATEADTTQAIRREKLANLWREHWYANLAGLLVAILLIYLAGRLFGNYVGRRIYLRLEALISRVPGFKQVYPHVKQFVDIIFGDNSAMKAFQEVVLVEYPRKGLWTIGLVSGEAFQELRDAAGGQVVTVFIATSPTPMTGFVINARRDEVIKLSMTIDQALRFIITAGVLTPENVSDAAAARAAEVRPLGAPGNGPATPL